MVRTLIIKSRRELSLCRKRVKWVTVMARGQMRNCWTRIRKSSMSWIWHPKPSRKTAEAKDLTLLWKSGLSSIRRLIWLGIAPSSITEALAENPAAKSGPGSSHPETETIDRISMLRKGTQSQIEARAERLRWERTSLKFRTPIRAPIMATNKTSNRYSIPSISCHFRQQMVNLRR